MKHGHRRSGLVGPFILVGIGLLFLLNNLGLVQVSFWRLAAALWPVVLIGVGLDLLIGRRSSAGSLLALLLTALFFVGGALFVGVYPNAAALGDVQDIRYAPGPVTAADIRISASTGRLTLDSHGDVGVLVVGSVRLGRNEKLNEETGEKNGKAIYRLSSSGVDVVGLSGNESVWNLRIDGETPTDLDVETGIGETELHLERMQLTALKVDLGVGATTIALPRSGTFTGEISGGIGKLVVRVPESLAVRIHVDTGIGQVQIGDGFSDLGDNVYLSSAAQTSGEIATLKVSSGIGQVVIESLAGE